ncbi:Amino acid adenylation (plasmid) [Trichormus variabilis ATCC 29413]|uniref:Amino acid adenylation n=3 Tax=Anabaena variabilis TaxID=264691 RepID=Q3M1P5_TRIV2|nr:MULTISPECIES: non-ribosomal peptide synthetase [Nostocaceae]ABA25098.1 Amino acid adenylation [Trichormus variabilis ATCC 29413]MBC1218251.1 non-ribosomal peptide synthetase [Trichormus variabilis ARAD]MBC1259532.1 non-ribosomal peptide synthetase [Trichormus variabilis V5]MBC1271072.1 non-ribosomal peptide synthetase [Trichormus variabilis FSR]MBC1305995.1 non-ribosomal peptide synthetase [Trichormus variabilis N2B]
MDKNLSQKSVEFVNLLEIIRWRSQKQPQQQAYCFLLDGEVEVQSLTYGELDNQAQRIAGLLQAFGVKKGERVLLLYPPGLEFITAFFGCLYAGAIAVPAYPPRANQSLSRLSVIATDADSTVALTTTTVLSYLQQHPTFNVLRLLTTDNMMADDWTNLWRQPVIDRDTLAFLQYTSGSTGTPKGVMVSHGNLLHNQLLIKQAMQHTTATIFVGWLPLFHDMGLVGNMLQPLYLGIPCILMSPVAFLQKPVRWLQAISQYRATTSGGPNFAYDLCVRKITAEQRATLDLSSWEVAFNGAEPVRQATLEKFAVTFGECGFRREAFYPCYGMAETTLIVSGGCKTTPPVLQPVQSDALAQNQIVPAKAGEIGTQILVGCGQPLADLKIVIVDPQTLSACSDRQVGEIWVAGASVAQGYWHQPEQTESTFKAYTKDTKEGPFLRTGDLGFLQDGELFITGRLKDLIIIRGRNYYPQDIENTVQQSHPALEPHGGAAFSIDVDGEERLVIAQEVQRSHIRKLDIDEVIATIRAAVAVNHEIQLYGVLLLKPGSILRTSSGKIQRYACRAKFLAGSWETIASSILEGMETGVSVADEIISEQPQLISYLQQQVAQILKVELSQIQPQQPLSTCGIDSLMAIELQHTVETKFGVVLAVKDFLADVSINQLATVILDKLSSHTIDEPVQNSHSSEYSLTYGQQALYFLQQLAPENYAYNIARAARIYGDLNIAAFHRAWQILVDRHPALRTSFITIDGQPRQRVCQQVEVCWLQQDATTWDETYLSDRLLEIAYRPFNLEQDPLMRLSLFTRSSQEHILLLVVHHIIADFWSLTILVDELGKLYQAENLPLITCQYADYVSTTAKMIASSQGEKLQAYWEQQLAGELPVLNVPADRMRPPMQTYRGDSISWQLGQELTNKLQNFSQQHQVTLYMTMLAVFQVLLYRYTGQEDLLVGSPTTGRSRADFAGLVGYFVNPIVLRANFAENPTFEQFLQQVRSLVLDALTHQDYPFARLVEQLQPTRDPSRSPIFQVMFVFQKAHLLNNEGLGGFALGEAGARLKLGELELESLPLSKRIAQFDLTLAISQVNGVLSTSWEYNADLFDAATITRMAGHFQTLLESIIVEPSQPVGMLPMLTQQEQQQLLLEWNATQKDYDSICLHQQFVTQVEKTPDAVAVVFEQEEITYKQLNQQANQLAHYLQGLGVKKEVLVGVYLERSPQMVVSILAILKAGGAYLPLDPSYPRERLAFMLQDAQVAVLLTQEKFLPSLPEHQATVVCLDKDNEVWASETIVNPVNEVTTHNLAYVIYTSGSTGRPKGVMNTHRGICNRLAWMQETYQLTIVDRVLQKTPFSFDVSIWEFFWPLTTGACLVMARPGGHQDSAYLVKLIQEQQITTIHFVPSMLQVFLAEPSVEACKCLRRVICSGEILPVQLQEHFFTRLDAELHNLYGPTEAAIDVTFWACNRHSDKNIVPIGRAIANTQIYILDKHLQPVPIGVPGELHIGGVGVARGYLNQPQLTAEKFIVNPFSNNSNNRLYKTGDLARYHTDGSIEYLGRLDDQVKLRGFRIELTEIESVLTQHPDVRKAVVVMRETSAVKRQVVLNPPENNSEITDLRNFLKGELTEELLVESTTKQLIAYCVCRHQPAPNITKLRRFLGEKLPDYMIPATFIMLDALPVTANGKLDKKSLPNPGQGRPNLEKSFVPPHTLHEKILAQIWSEVLGIEQVGIHDNFFELGGDSIRSIQVVAKAQERGLSFSVAQVFQHQTIYNLLTAISLNQLDSLLTEKTAAFSLISAIERDKLPNNIEDAYPLTRVQTGIIFHSQYNLESLMYHDIFQYHLRVRFDLDLLQMAIEQLVTRHPILRTSFDLINFDEPLQLVHQSACIPVVVENLRSLLPAAQIQVITSWIEIEKHQRFDLSCPPLMRLFIHRLTDETFCLTLSWHNSILDGWSNASLLTELLQRYHTLLNGEENQIESALTISYRDFVAVESQILQSPEYQNYWQQKLQGLVIKPIPRWDKNNAKKNVQVGVLDVPISPQVSHGLKQLARLAEVPLKNVLLAAHLKVMSLLINDEDVLTGLESNSRLEEADGEKTLGTFINTIPLRLQLEAGTWIELVQQAFAAEQELLPYRHYPYSELQKFGNRQPLQPLLETVFNYTHFHVYQRLQDLSGLEIIGGQGFGESNFTLRVEFNRNHITDHIQLDLECKIAEISSTQLAAIGSYYSETLIAMATQPFNRHEEQCLLSTAQQQQILVEWNETAIAYPENLCIHQQFEAQVVRNPDAIALVYENEQLTYQELNRRANLLANHLQRLGVCADTLVAICVERSLEAIVGILGILKAGGAYLPLDPTYPSEHLAFILKDTQVSLLLTQSQLLPKIPNNKAQTLCLDSEWDIIANNSDDNPSCRTTKENLAYVIYTSGSTGNPKGVLITHQNLVHSTNARIAYYQTPISSFLLIPSFAFDSSVAVIFWTLCQGGKLILIKDGWQRDIWQLAQLIEQHQITHWLSVPSLYNSLLAHIEKQQLISLQTIIVAGETCSIELVKNHQKLLPNTSLFNEYGPTETTVWSSVYNCSHHDLNNNSIPIGRPISNTQIYILNSHLQPVPIGTPGEIYIGGFGVSKGYLNRPELTIEKFIPDPFSKQPNARLYKTGDQARYLSNGNIEFIGRIDHQIKLRGYRIELGEIEAVLQQHPQVKQAIVIARNSDSENQQLVAYIVPSQTQDSLTNELRSFLQTKLPNYMIPSVILQIDTLPLTPNGKIDRQKLPTPEQLQPNNELLTELLKKLNSLSETEVKTLLSQKNHQPN